MSEEGLAKQIYQLGQALAAQIDLTGAVLTVLTEKKLLSTPEAASLVELSMNVLDPDNPMREGYRLLVAEFRE